MKLISHESSNCQTKLTSKNTKVDENIMNQQMIGWSAVVAWITFSGYFIHESPTTMTLKEILLMMPQWCEMKDLATNKGYILLSPQTTLWCCFTTLMLLSICWFFTAEEDLEEISSDVVQVDQDTKANLVHDEITEDVLLENAKSLLDMVDLEYKHCAATIAANNETPGRKVGGETEWATGKCLSTLIFLIIRSKLTELGTEIIYITGNLFKTSKFIYILVQIYEIKLGPYIL